MEGVAEGGGESGRFTALGVSGKAKKLYCRGLLAVTKVVLVLVGVGRWEWLGQMACGHLVCLGVGGEQGARCGCC